MRKRLILLLAVLVALGGAWVLWRQYSVASSASSSGVALRKEPGAASSTQAPLATEGGQSASTLRTPPLGAKGADNGNDERYLDKIAPIFLRSLVFYGEVVDEENAPVPDAKVRFSLMNNPNPNGAGTHGETVSDGDGRFVINGRGMGIYVEVSKPGYYQVPESEGRRGSTGGFRNHENLSNTEVAMPAKGQPAIFLLRKMGRAAPLVHIGPISIIMPKNGTPTDLDLMTGQIVQPGEGQLRVEAWTQNQGMNPNKGEPYDWRCRLTVPGGGIVERNGTFDFEAPEGAYESSAELAEDHRDTRWRDNLSKQFFVRLLDGRYARISIEMITSGDHFVVFESFLNPVPGNRNLEFDSGKPVEL
jgi:hypothetical protein